MTVVAVAASQHSEATGPIPGLLPAEWYAAYTRPRHEKKVAEQLERKAVETFLPVYETIRKWRNGRHRIQLPLFPGYTFVRISLKDRLEVLRVPGVVNLVGSNGTPAALQEGELMSLRRALSLGKSAEPHPFLTEGHRVRITSGPFSGLQGVLKRRKGQCCVVVSLELIQRSVLVELDSAELEPLV